MVEALVLILFSVALGVCMFLAVAKGQGWI